jgi:hypothetical protein
VVLKVGIHYHVIETSKDSRMRVVSLGLLLCFGAAHADQVAESIARSREKLEATPVVITNKTREWLRKERQEKERAEKLLPPAKPAPALEPPVEQQVADDLRRTGME